MELLIYTFLDKELQEVDLQELLSSSCYSDNINFGGMTDEEFNRRYDKVVESFSKYGLFFKTPVEPWSQMLQGDDRLQQEKLVATLGFFLEFTRRCHFFDHGALLGI